MYYYYPHFTVWTLKLKEIRHVTQSNPRLEPSYGPKDFGTGAWSPAYQT